MSERDVQPPRGDVGPARGPAASPPILASTELGKMRPPPGRWRGVAWRVVKIASFVGLALSAILSVAVFFTIRHYETGLPSVEQLRAGYDPPQVTRVLARDGTLLANLFTERRTVVPIAELPPRVKLAFLAAEDASFYEHEGVSYLGMVRALFANLRAGHTVAGGSTITQQVVKNILLDPERTYSRKIKETILARRLEQHLSKDEILGLYLNHVYFGAGRYGVEEAARNYFGKHAKELEVPEAALLAGTLASPARFSPRTNLTGALERRRFVLGQMLEKGFITKELYDQSMEAPVRLAPEVEAESELAPEVVGYVKKLLQRVAGERARKGGFTVTTTISPALQSAARKAARDNLATYAKRQKLEPPFTLAKRRLWGAPFSGTPKEHRVYVGTVKALDDATSSIELEVGDALGRVQLDKEERYNPKRAPPSQFTAVGATLRVSLLAPPDPSAPVPLRLELGPETALVAIDVRTREVLALIGSYEALGGGLDRALQARRQPGSSFKAFVYSYALRSRRFTPSSVLELPPDKKHPGAARTLSLREAVARSDNGAAERVFREVGPANVVEWARALGISSHLEPNLSLALGAYEVTPLEMANAYTTFASGGEYAEPVLVTKILGPDGKEVPLPPVPPARRVMQPDEAFLITSLLESVVKSGTGRRASTIGFPVAGKTGTTNQSKDAWFVGYSTDLAAAVWVGYDDANPLGWGEEGAVTALPEWIAFMKAAHQGRPPTEFPRPGSIVSARIDPATGLLAPLGADGGVDEDFLEGTVPDASAPLDAGVEAAAEAPDAGAPSELEEPPTPTPREDSMGNEDGGPARPASPNEPALPPGPPPRPDEPPGPSDEPPPF